MLHQRIITWVVLGAVALAPLAGVVAQQQPATTPSREEFREEFHQSYPLSPTGRVSLENINGSVRITGWERNEVKLDAVKRSHTRERLAEAEIRVETTADALRIKTRYPERSFIQDGNGRRYEDPASVDYTLTVPRGARLEGIALINGSLDIEGVNGDVHGSSINGRVTARGLTARTKLSTVNGTTEAVFTQLGEPGVVELSSVNGAVQVTIPSDANAEVKANTVHGQITNDFGLPVRRGRFVGRDLAGVLGRGGTLLRLSNVNGTVRITRANDGKQQSTVRNLLSEARADDEDEPEGPDEVEIGPGEVSAEVNREVAREVAKAQREAERELRANRAEIQREAAAAAREAAREVAREAAEVSREVSRAVGEGFDDRQAFDQQTKTFTTNGAPRVRIETFDGYVTVRAWDKAEVQYTAFKRAHDEREMRGVNLRAEQAGNDITLSAQFDKSFASDVRRSGNRVVSFSSGAVVNYEVFVPRNASLHVNTGDGRLSVEGVNGELNLLTGDGPVDVSGGRGRLHVQTGDGRINVTNYDGEVEARTGDGRIALDGRFARLAATTGDGSIQLSVPKDLNAVIETDSESVVNDGLASEEGDGAAEGRRVRRWKVGSGGDRTFSLRTGHGRVIMRRR